LNFEFKKCSGTFMPQSGWGEEMIIKSGLSSFSLFPNFSKLSMVFLTCFLSSSEPTEGKIIGGWGEMQAKIIINAKIKNQNVITKS
jgi:hypothetical protein